MTTTPTRPRPESLTLHLAAAPAQVDAAARTISGLAVPYGPVGNSSLGPITFSQGSLSWSSAGRVKFLMQHDPERSNGYALTLDDRPDGLWAVFQVADGPDGDKALAEAADGRRDGLSVGVLLTDEVLAEIVEKWWDGDTSPTAAAGRLLEISQVSIPAFDDARIPSSAAANLQGHLTLAVTMQSTPETSRDNTRKKDHPMPETTATPAQAAADQSSLEATVQAAVQAAVAGIATAAPAPNPAATGTAQVSAEAPVYTFDGRGPSFCRDVFHARFSADLEAAGRLRSFNDRMLSNDAAQVGRVTAAVETRTTAPNFINNPTYRPEMLVEVIDKGRPLVSRIGTVPLTDATPYRLPVEGEMTGGVGDHTEGTAHVAEGDLAIGDVTITPGAISGAFRLSRELIDSSNPALDIVALRAMLRQYRYATEAKVAAALAAADGTATVSINTVQKLRLEINSYYDVNLEDPTGVAAHPGFYAALLGDVDTTGRPMLATINPTNAAGTVYPGHTGGNVDGVEIHKAYAASANDAWLYNAGDVHIGESAVQTFRFDEIEGPGVIKLALWAYFVAKVTRASSVVKVTSAGTD